MAINDIYCALIIVCICVSVQNSALKWCASIFRWYLWLLVRFFFHIASRIDRKPILFLLIVWPWLDRRQWCAKNICIFSYLETPNRSSPYVFAERSSPYFFFAEICCRLFTDKCHQSIEMRPFWFETSIHRNETILIWNYSNFSVNWPNANYVVLFNSKRFLFAMK